MKTTFLLSIQTTKLLTEFHHFNLLQTRCQYGYNVRMPKKTKKEKIAASKNKVNSPIHPSIHISYTENYTNGDNDMTASHISSSDRNKKQRFDEADLQKNSLNFRIDLKRSLTIIFVILALELMLYYASIQGLFKFI